MMGFRKNSLLSLALLTLLLVACGKGEAPDEQANEEEGDKQTYAGKMLGSLDRTAIMRTRADMESIGRALEMYATSTGGYPVAADINALKTVLVPTYTRQFPERDQWANLLQAESTETSYRITAAGADGVTGTEDDFVLDQSGMKLPKGAPGGP